MSTKMTVMTFNLRVAAKMDGINHFDNRRGRILETIKTHKPDLIGFQEARDEARDWLRDTLDEYTVIGCGRLADCRGESVPLAFRKDKFMMINSESFWLSSTPDVPGSTYEGTDQSSCPRMCTVAWLKHLENDRFFLFVNTHTDHSGALARLLASNQILQYLSKKKLPAIVTGDFNAVPDSREIQLLTSNSIYPMVDATANVKHTFHNYGKNKGDAEIKIDYVFTSMAANFDEAYGVEDIPVDGVYISDHRPVMASVTLD